MDLQSLINQLSVSKNPLNMLMGLFPNQKNILSSISNAGTDEQKAQILADLCNKNGITKQQLEQELRQRGF
jgi:hypothetical protein